MIKGARNRIFEYLGIGRAERLIAAWNERQAP
jgi:hypothetical protein